MITPTSSRSARARPSPVRNMGILSQTPTNRQLPQLPVDRSLTGQRSGCDTRPDHREALTRRSADAEPMDASVDDVRVANGFDVGQSFSDVNGDVLPGRRAV